MTRIGLVGHCGPDTSRLILAVNRAAPGARVERIDSDDELRGFVDAGPGLLLVNRVLDGMFADESGINLIRRLSQTHPAVRTMLISNFEDAQQEAVGAGARPGFGKRDAGSPRAVDLIKAALAPGGS